MIRKLLATTAIVLLTSGGIYAQGMAPVDTAAKTDMVIQSTGHLASDLIGESIYNGPGADAQNIGKVSDLVIDDAGTIQAIVVGVGGFLGIGQKEVPLEYSLVKWAQQSDGAVRLTVDATKDSLEKLPAFDPLAYKPMPADATVAPVKPADSKDLSRAAAEANAPAGTTAAPTPANTPAVTPPVVTPPAVDTVIVDRSTLVIVEPDKISTEKLIGTTVYGAGDDRVGKVSDVILNASNQADAIIIDVGGFLGIGAKPVAVSMEKLDFYADKDGDYYLYTPFTKAALEAQPEYNANEYATNRDRYLLRLP